MRWIAAANLAPSGLTANGGVSAIGDLLVARCLARTTEAARHISWRCGSICGRSMHKVPARVSADLGRRDAR